MITHSFANENLYLVEKVKEIRMIEYPQRNALKYRDSQVR